jgi:hypothetical protein
MPVTKIQPLGVNSNATFTFANVTVTGNLIANVANLGNVANIKISGGTANYVLKTDGAGNLSWTSLPDVSNFATTTEVSNAVANLVNSAPAVLDTLGELSNALGNDASFSTSVTNSLANKLSTNAFSNTANDWVANYLPNYIGNLAAGNANLGNAVVANFFVGNGSQLTGISAVTAVSLVNGNSNIVVAANANATISVAGNANIVTVTGTGANISGYANVTGNLSVGGISNLGNVGNVRITGGSADQYLKTDGTGNLIWDTVIGGGGGGGGTYTAATTPPASGNSRGDMWYNTSSDVLYEYISDGTGNYWVDVQSPTIASTDPTAYVSRTYTANGSGTTYTVTQGANIHNVLVYLNGIAQLPTTDYTINGTTLTFDSAPANGTLVFIRELMPPPATDITQTIGTINVITTANINTLNVTANTTTGNLQVSGNIVANGVSNLGAIGNVRITGGSNGQIISTDGNGNLSFTSVTATRAAAVIMGIVFGG